MVWVVFCFTLIYSMLGHIMIYFFEEKRKQLQIEFNDEAYDFTDVEISNHSVLIRGINKNMSRKWAETVINNIFIKMEEPEK